MKDLFNIFIDSMAALTMTSLTLVCLIIAVEGL